MLGLAPRPLYEAALPEASVLAACFSGYEELVAEGAPDGDLVTQLHVLQLRQVVDNVLGAWPGLFKLWESRPGHCLVMSHTGADDHAELLLRLAVRLRGQFAEERLPSGAPVRLLMSICSGPLAAGVVGGGQLQYHAFGPAALLARAIIREAYQSAPPDAILVSEATRQLLGDRGRSWKLFCHAAACPGAARVPVYLYTGNAAARDPAVSSPVAPEGRASASALDAAAAAAAGGSGDDAPRVYPCGRAPPWPEDGSSDEERSVCAAAGPAPAYPPIGGVLRAVGALVRGIAQRAGSGLAAPFRALRFEDPRIEARFQRGYYASQYHTDLVFFVILVLCQAAWVVKWELNGSAACLAAMVGLLCMNTALFSWALCVREAYLLHRDTIAPIVFVAHRMAQAIVTLHGTTQSAEFTPQNALIESSYLAATFMLTFGLKMRWHLHVPVNAFFVAVTLLQNSYVCRAAWPEVPGRTCAVALGCFEVVACFGAPCALLWAVERRARRHFAACCKAVD